MNTKYLIFIFIFLAGCLYSQEGLYFVSDFGKFQDAASISTSREEFIFVSDLGSNKIYKLSAQGVELASFGGVGLGTNELNQPYSIDASNGLDVLVADYQNNRIKRLDINLNFITQFDFNTYNLTAESTDKIYNPKGITTLSTGEVYVLCDATNHKVAKVSDFIELKLLFGSNSIGIDKLDTPKKIVKGSQLDMWILDKGTNEIINFNNFGVYQKKISPADKSVIISIAFYNDNLFILAAESVIIYDLKKGQYTQFYKIPSIKDLKDIVLLDKGTVLLLSKTKISKFTLN
jgi:hypothetical protein